MYMHGHVWACKPTRGCVRIMIVTSRGGMVRGIIKVVLAKLSPELSYE